MTLEVPPSVDFTDGEFVVRLTGSSTEGLRGFSALIGYDPAAMTPVSLTFQGTVW